MPGFVRRNAKAIPLVGGFCFGMVGAIWSFTVDRRIGEELARLNEMKADVAGQVRTLNTLASEYFIANQQGDLIFVTAHQNNARADVAELIYKSGLLDRAVPVRNMIGALAVAKVLDYRTTYDAYTQLNDRARAEFSLDAYTRLKQLEAEIIAKGQERVPVLVKAGFDLDRMIEAGKDAQRKNGVVGLVSSLLGGFLLLLANLVATRQKDESRPKDDARPTAPAADNVRVVRVSPAHQPGYRPAAATGRRSPSPTVGGDQLHPFSFMD